MLHAKNALGARWAPFIAAFKAAAVVRKRWWQRRGRSASVCTGYSNTVMSMCVKRSKPTKRPIVCGPQGDGAQGREFRLQAGAGRRMNEVGASFMARIMAAGPA